MAAGMTGATIGERSSSPRVTGLPSRLASLDRSFTLVGRS
jgi:hypothetical protein